MASKIDDLPQLFFPKKRFICFKPSIFEYFIPRNLFISIL